MAITEFGSPVVLVIDHAACPTVKVYSVAASADSTLIVVPVDVIGTVPAW